MGREGKGKGKGEGRRPVYPSYILTAARAEKLMEGIVNGQIDGRTDGHIGSAAQHRRAYHSLIT